MPDIKYVILPKNLTEDKKHKGRTIYTSDYCRKKRPILEKRKAKSMEEPGIACRIYDPGTRFLHDHYRTSAHGKLKDHYKKILSHIERNSSAISTQRGHHRGKSAPTYDHVPRTSELTDDEAPVVDVLPPSLRKIESAWQQEVNTTKRVRDTIYGNAGAKKWFKQRQLEDNKRNSDSMLIPGLKAWLHEANEYEKHAVHNFMKNVSKAIKEDQKSTEPPKVKLDVRDERQIFSDDPKLEDFMDEVDDHSDAERVLSPPPFQGDHDDVIDEQLSQSPSEMPQTPLPTSQNNLLEEIDLYKNVHFRNPTRETILSQRESKLLQGRESASSFKSIEVNKQPRQGARSALASRTHEISYHEDKPRPNSSPGMCSKQQNLENRPTSSLSSSSSTHRLLPRANTAYGYPHAETPEVVQQIFSNTASSSQSVRSHTTEVDQKIFSNSALQSQSAPKKRTIHAHNDPKCVKCMDREVKKMAEKLSEMALDSYGKPIQDKHKLAISPLVDYGFTSDYVHKYSVFKDSSPNDRGYYIIHPEWISEKSKPRKNYKVIGCYL